MSPLPKKALDGNVETIILSELVSGEEYGYALVKRINSKHAGLLNLREGTVYPVLYRLESRGLISSQVRSLPSGKERKYYRLSPKGKLALEDNLRNWKDLAKVMDNIQTTLQGTAIETGQA